MGISGKLSLGCFSQPVEQSFLQFSRLRINDDLHGTPLFRFTERMVQRSLVHKNYRSLIEAIEMARRREDYGPVVQITRWIRSDCKDDRHGWSVVPVLHPGGTRCIVRLRTGERDIFSECFRKA